MVLDNPPHSFDLEGYIKQYKGFSKIARLLFISEKAPIFQAQALKLAIDELKTNTMNTKLYREIVTKNGEAVLGPEYGVVDTV